MPNTYTRETTKDVSKEGEREESVIAANNTGAQQAEVSPDINPKIKTLAVFTFLFCRPDTWNICGKWKIGLSVITPIKIMIKAPR